MAYTLLLNNEDCHMAEHDLSCLITYREKVGGSQFTVSLITDMFLRGSKILFFTAYASARENFLEQIRGLEAKTAYIESPERLESEKNTQMLMLKSGDERLFITAMHTLSDIHERVVLIKNIEVFSQEVFDASLSLKKIILSGNIDDCVARQQICDKKYGTNIIFSQPEMAFAVSAPPLERYTGYLVGQGINGPVSLQM